MDTRRYSDEERELYRKRVDEAFARKEEIARKKNRLYRRTPFFITTLSLRLAYLLFFIIIFFFHGGPLKWKAEVVEQWSSGEYLSGIGVKVMQSEVKTNKAVYKMHFERESPRRLQKGDTVFIGRNILKKPCQMDRRAWEGPYDLALNWPLYIIVGVFTLISLSFNEHDDKHTVVVIWVAWTVNLIAFACYIIGM